MPRNPNYTNHDALRDIAAGRTPGWHQLRYFMAQGWATRERLPVGTGKTWRYELTDKGREVIAPNRARA